MGIIGAVYVWTFNGVLYGGNDSTKKNRETYLSDGVEMQRVALEGLSFGDLLRKARVAKTAANNDNAKISNAIRAYQAVFDDLAQKLRGAWGRIFGTGSCRWPWNGGRRTDLSWNKPTIPAPLEFWKEDLVFKHDKIQGYVFYGSPISSLHGYKWQFFMADFLPTGSLSRSAEWELSREYWEPKDKRYIDHGEALYRGYVIGFFKEQLRNDKLKVSLPGCAEFLDNRFCKPVAELLERQCARLVQKARFIHSGTMDFDEFLVEFREVLTLYAAYRDFGMEYANRENYLDGKVPNVHDANEGFGAEAFYGDRKYQNSCDTRGGCPQYRYAELKKAIFTLTEYANSKFGTRKGYTSGHSAFLENTEPEEDDLTAFDKVLRECEQKYRVTFLPLKYYDFGKKMIERESWRRSFVLTHRLVVYSGVNNQGISREYTKVMGFEEFMHEYEKRVEVVNLKSNKTWRKWYNEECDGEVGFMDYEAVRKRVGWLMPPPGEK